MAAVLYSISARACAYELLTVDRRKLSGSETASAVCAVSTELVVESDSERTAVDFLCYLALEMQIQSDEVRGPVRESAALAGKATRHLSIAFPALEYVKH